jgi:hypothetical protein
MYGQHNAKRAPMEPLQWSDTCWATARSPSPNVTRANLDVLREAVATLDRKTENQTGTKTGTSPVLKIRAS